MKTAEIGIDVSGGRNREGKLVIPEKKIYIPQSKLERRINPFDFPTEADWMQYEPRTDNQKKIKDLFLDARAKDRLHSFTCMAIAPSLDSITGELIYQPGLPSAVEHSNNFWQKIFRSYDPNRNSRQMAQTEYVCKCLFIIWKLVEERYWDYREAWYMVCDYSNNYGKHSRKLGYFGKTKLGFEPTGKGEICGFFDMFSTGRMIAEDAWNKDGGFWYVESRSESLTEMKHQDAIFADRDYCDALGELVFD